MRNTDAGDKCVQAEDSREYTANVRSRQDQKFFGSNLYIGRYSDLDSGTGTGHTGTQRYRHRYGYEKKQKGKGA